MRLVIKNQARAVNAEQGFILITVLLLVSILSMSAYLAMERSQLSLRTNQSRLAYHQAKYNAEESRRMALPIIQAQLIEQTIKPQAMSGIQLNTNVSKLISTANPNRLNKASLIPFMSVQQADIQGEVFILALPGRLNTQGVSVVQHRAYQGPGQGLGSAASFSRFFELRAKGIAHSRGKEVSYWNASDYRFVP